MRLSSALQYLLPHRFLSRLVYWGTRWTWRPWKNFLISTVVKQYKVDMSEAEQTDALAFPFFNAFFTRALKPGARSAPADPAAIACPADGRVSQLGHIVDDTIDLEQAIIDAVALDLPFAPVCRPDCPGLCPECGIQLAAEPGHHHDGIDPRWAKLAGMVDPEPDTSRGEQ